MTDTTDVAERESHEVATHDAGVPALPGQVHPHPTPRQYVIIAVVLVVVTAVEVATSYLEGDVNANLIIVLLGVMAAVKFFLVAAWYMHLRTDLPMFRRIFVVGLIGATIVYAAALASLHVFAQL
jgi:cytochrome c oxidase subunit 4